MFVSVGDTFMLERDKLFIYAAESGTIRRI